MVCLLLWGEVKKYFSGKTGPFGERESSWFFFTFGKRRERRAFLLKTEILYKAKKFCLVTVEGMSHEPVKETKTPLSPSAYTSSRLSVLMRMGGKHTLQSPKP